MAYVALQTLTCLKQSLQNFYLRTLKMNRELYIKTTDYFRNNKKTNKILFFIYKILPAVPFFSYPLFLIWAFMQSTDKFWLVLLMPAGIFFLVSLLRIIINEKRPYEKYNHNPVFKKDTIGKSMPSRHTASTFIISMAVLKINIIAGIILLCISVLIAISRVLSGVHYIRDVIAGAVISISTALAISFIF